MVLWLWRRLAAVAMIGSLAWEPSYAAGAALKSKKQTNKKKKKISQKKKKKTPSMRDFPGGAVGEGSDVVTAAAQVASVAWV